MATWDDRVLPTGIARVSFEYMLVLTILDWLSLLVRGRVPVMLVVTKWNRKFAENIFSCLFVIGDMSFRAHVLQLRKLSVPLVAMCDLKKYSLLELVDSRFGRAASDSRMTWAVQEAFTKRLRHKYLNRANDECHFIDQYLLVYSIPGAGFTYTLDGLSPVWAGRLKLKKLYNGGFFPVLLWAVVGN